MTHPAVYIVSIGLAVGAVLFSYFVSRQHERPYSYNYSNTPKGGFCLDEDNLCTICRYEIKNDNNRTYLNCGHSFHTKCITPWLRTSDLCPNCRQKVLR